MVYISYMAWATVAASEAVPQRATWAWRAVSVTMPATIWRWAAAGWWPCFICWRMFSAMGLTDSTVVAGFWIAAMKDNESRITSGPMASGWAALRARAMKPPRLWPSTTGKSGAILCPSWRAANSVVDQQETFGYPFSC